MSMFDLNTAYSASTAALYNAQAAQLSGGSAMQSGATPFANIQNILASYQNSMATAGGAVVGGVAGAALGGPVGAGLGAGLGATIGSSLGSQGNLTNIFNGFNSKIGQITEQLNSATPQQSNYNFQSDLIGKDLSQNGTALSDNINKFGTRGDDYGIIKGGRGSDNINVFGGRGNDMFEIKGGRGNDNINAFGGRGNDVLFADGGRGKDNINLYGGRGNDLLVADGGRGNDKIYASGGKGNDQIFINGGRGNDNIRARGGAGDDVITVKGGDNEKGVFNKLFGGNTIDVKGGTGNDTINVTGGNGNDRVKINGGEGFDRMNYTVTEGRDNVTVNGGKDGGRFNLNVGPNDNVTVVDKEGNVLYKQGNGKGTTITVSNVNQFSVTGEDGRPVFAASNNGDGFQQVRPGTFEMQDRLQEMNKYFGGMGTMNGLFGMNSMFGMNSYGMGSYGFGSYNMGIGQNQYFM
ncbi:hypothetical protein IJT10_03485 [bacterium]|nr:hypothetical protein [bacterium]